MNSFERMERAVEARPVDQIPASVWCHFGTEHLPPDAVAKLHADYQAAYRWDFMKVMFDYRLHVPDSVDGPAGLDLQLMLDTVDWAAPFQRQIEVLQYLRSSGEFSVPIVDTIYSPWMYLVRHLGADLTEQILEQHHLLAGIMARLTEESCKHVRRVRDIGCFGIYLPTLAAAETSWSGLREMQSTYDKEVLRAASGMVRMLHLHGEGLDVEAIADHPREVLHWDDSEPANPSLSQFRAGNRCLMGGLAPSALTSISMSAFRNMATDAIAHAGALGFVLAPGCTVSPSLSARKLLALRDVSMLRFPA